MKNRMLSICLLNFAVLMLTSSSFAGSENSALEFNRGDGLAETVLTEMRNYIQITGDAAKLLYLELEGEVKSKGEADPSVYFKEGKSYLCFEDKSDADHSAYSCTITLQSTKKGEI